MVCPVPNIITTGDLMSPATERRALKKNGQERNKLQLTLPSGGKDNGCQQRIEETYIEMSTSGTLRSQSSYNQATPV